MADASAAPPAAAGRSKEAYFRGILDGTVKPIEEPRKRGAPVRVASDDESVAAADEAVAADGGGGGGGGGGSKPAKARKKKASKSKQRAATIDALVRVGAASVVAPAAAAAAASSSSSSVATAAASSSSSAAQPAPVSAPAEAVEPASDDEAADADPKRRSTTAAVWALAPLAADGLSATCRFPSHPSDVSPIILLPKTKSSTNAIRHMERNHGTAYVSFQRLIKKDGKTAEFAATTTLKLVAPVRAKVQPAITAFKAAAGGPLAPISAVSSSLDFTRVLLDENLPDTFAESSSLAAWLAPHGVKIPTVREHKRNVDVIYSAAVAQMRAEVNAAGGYSLSSDASKGRDKQDYVTIKIHYTKADWSHIVVRRLAFVHFPDAKTGQAMSAATTARVEEVLGTDSTALMNVCATDNARNALNQGEGVAGEGNGHGCSNHLLALVIGDVFCSDSAGVPGECDLSKVARALASYSAKVIHNKAVLQAFESSVANPKQLHPKLHHEIRWNGLYDMAARADETKDTFSECAPLLEPANPELVVFAAKSAAGIVALLAPFASISKSWQSVSMPTGAMVPNMVHDLIGACKPEPMDPPAVATARSLLLARLRVRFDNYGSGDSNNILAASVDPYQRRQLRRFVAPDVLPRAQVRLVQTALQMLKDADQNVLVAPEIEYVMKKLDEIADVAVYKDDPLAFYRGAPWRAKVGTVLPAIALVLTTPAGESSCESDFFHAKLVMSKLRTSIDSERMERIMVAKDYVTAASYKKEEMVAAINKLFGA